MGDAGPQTPEPLLAQETAQFNGAALQDAEPLREVTVLITGFGVGLFPSCCFAAAFLVPFALCGSGTSRKARRRKAGP